MSIAEGFLTAIVNTFEANKRLADRAVEQLPDEKLHTALDPNTNSVAVIMKHVAGNLTSRWTDFLKRAREPPRGFEPLPVVLLRWPQASLAETR